MFAFSTSVTVGRNQATVIQNNSFGCHHLQCSFTPQAGLSASFLPPSATNQTIHFELRWIKSVQDDYRNWSKFHHNPESRSKYHTDFRNCLNQTWLRSVQTLFCRNTVGVLASSGVASSVWSHIIATDSDASCDTSPEPGLCTSKVQTEIQLSNFYNLKRPQKMG